MIACDCKMASDGCDCLYINCKMTRPCVLRDTPMAVWCFKREGETTLLWLVLKPDSDCTCSFATLSFYFDGQIEKYFHLWFGLVQPVCIFSWSHREEKQPWIDIHKKIKLPGFVCLLFFFYLREKYVNQNISTLCLCTSELMYTSL